MPSIAESARTENLQPTYRRLLGTFVDRAIAKPEVEGVVVLGGLANGGGREFADAVSDLDVALVLSLPLTAEVLALDQTAFLREVRPFLPAWLPNFKFRVPDRFTGMGRGIDIDVHQLILEREASAHVRWDDAKLEAYQSTSEIVHDRSGRVRRLIDDKIRTALPRLEDHLVRTVAMTHVLAKGAVDRSVERGYLSHAHEILNSMLDDLIVGIFAVNGSFPPDRKWRVASVSGLPWSPVDARARLESVLIVEAHDERSVRRRQAELVSLLEDLHDRCRQTRRTFPVDPYSAAVTSIYTDRQLLVQTEADRLVAPTTDQYDKMRNDAWCACNWTLGDSA